MGLFWRRKSGDEFVKLGLNEPAVPEVKEEPPVDTRGEEPVADVPELVPPVAGADPSPTPVESKPVVDNARPTVPTEFWTPAPVREKPVESPFATSVLGLNLSMEQLQAQEAALEQEFSARFR